VEVVEVEFVEVEKVVEVVVFEVVVFEVDIEFLRLMLAVIDMDLLMLIFDYYQAEEQRNFHHQYSYHYILVNNLLVFL
jgi:hypothetical protein